jgi:uncharacterized membrane protein
MALKKKILKSISWRVHASVATILISYLFTGKWEIAGAIGGTLMIIKLVMYVYHEKLWDDWLKNNFEFLSGGSSENQKNGENPGIKQ